MSNVRIRSASTDFFIAAALLALFGAASTRNAGAHGGLQIVLAVLMGAAGAFLRGGTDEARLVGLAAAGLTVAVGGYALIVQGDYFVGTIVAVFAIFRLWNAGTPMLPQVATPPIVPMVAFDAPDAHVRGVVPPQPTAAPEQAPYFAPPVRRADDPT
jgi:hypothetical protein